MAFVLAHLRMMRLSGLFNTSGTGVQPFLISGAIYQMDLPSRAPIPIPKEVESFMAEFGLSELEKAKIREKCFTTQDAHVLPCQVLLNGRPLSDYLNSAQPASFPKMAFAHLRGQFGRVDRMPRIFNETDSHAEKLGFRDALVEACQGIANAPFSGKDHLDHMLIEQVYKKFVDRAASAADEGVRRQQALAARKTGDFAERFYRLAKAELFGLYGKFTRAERPDLLTPHGMRHFVAEWGSD